MKKMNLLLASALVGLSAACAKTVHLNQAEFNHAAPVVAAPAPDVPELTRCQKINNWLKQTPPEVTMPVQQVEIERIFQRVIRKDCSGGTASDRVETTQSPTQDFVLKNPNWRTFKSVWVYDQENCEEKSTEMPVWNLPLIGQLFSITGNGWSGIRVKGDLANALLTYQVAEGMNHISVRYDQSCQDQILPFQEIEPDEVTKACASKTKQSIVLYPVQVHYTEKRPSEILTITPDAEDCQVHAQK